VRWLLQPLPMGLAVFLIAAGPAMAASIALFPVEFRSTSLEPVHAAELQRLELVHRVLADKLTALGFTIIATEAVADQVDDYAYLHECGGCEANLAKTLGADLAGVAWIQKVSNLILNVNLSLRDAATAAVVKGGSVDIRSNDDRSWVKGTEYLIDKRLFRDR